MPPQRVPAMRSLRSVHDPHMPALGSTNGASPAPTGHHAERRQVRGTRRAALWATVQVGRLARPVAQVAAELGASWHTAMDAVPDGA